VTAASKPEKDTEPEGSEPEEPAAEEPEPASGSSETAHPYRGATPSGAKKTQPTIWQRAVYRWTAITVVMAALLILYTQHPYYRSGQFAPWRSFYPTAFVAWLVGGIFYCKATLEKFSERRYMMRDGGLHLLLLGNALFSQEWLRRVGARLLVVIAYLAAWTFVQDRLHALTSDAANTVKALGGFALGLWTIFSIKGVNARRFWRLVKNPRVRTTLLGICVKGFFTPLMTGFVSGHAGNIADAWLRHKHLAPLKFQNTGGLPWTVASMWWNQVGSRLHELVPTGADLAWLFAPWTWVRDEWRWFLDLAYDVVFFVDCGWALMGYSSESRWLGNKTRSVEPTAFGWAVCLACYPPYNNVLGTYLPLENGPQHITDATWLLVFKGVTVALFAIYSSATVAFGFKFSNLTNRGIVTRGPYRFVRHPAYLCKCTAWWLEHIPTLTLQKAFFLTLLCSVYALRAWTEERHLGKDPEYLEYKKKTPWVIFPGIY
jgi:protein-S-isoprenylcysteine O-methyltransferase Ste14